jgi:hypothetical protein
MGLGLRRRCRPGYLTGELLRYLTAELLTNFGSESRSQKRRFFQRMLKRNTENTVYRYPVATSYLGLRFHAEGDCKENVTRG